MQRSFGKKILAVVAGAGLAAGGLAISTPVAQAGEASVVLYESGWAEAPNDAGLRMAQTAKLAECGPESPWTRCMILPYSEYKNLGTEENPEYIFEWQHVLMGYYETGKGEGSYQEAVDIADEVAPIPAPCWSRWNCPVGGAIQAAVPEFMIAGVPQQVVVYASWRPDESTVGEPTNGDAVISLDGEPVAAAPFVDGVATFSFTPKEPGFKDATISGVLNSNTSGANAWIDTVRAGTTVLEWDPEALEEALKNKKVEVGDTYTLEEVAQAKTALGKRLEWRVAQDSKDVCAVTTTKKGEVRAKFTESGKCSIIWTDPKKDEEGKYTFKVTA